jgi:hypothetical protein
MYPKGNIADPMMKANYPERENAVFNDVAYASMVFQLNRDRPKFIGVPVVKFLVEGMKVYDITNTGGVYELNFGYMGGGYDPAPHAIGKAYSNNPARCLLDYLLNPVYGKGMQIGAIDLESFYNAKVLCDKIVQKKVLAQGHSWSPSVLGGNLYPVTRGGWSDWLNKWGAWSGPVGYRTLDRTYDVYIPTTASYTFTAACDDAGEVYFDGSLVLNLPKNNWKWVGGSTYTATLTEGVHTVRIICHDLAIDSVLQGWD